MPHETKNRISIDEYDLKDIINNKKKERKCKMITRDEDATSTIFINIITVNLVSMNMNISLRKTNN